MPRAVHQIWHGDSIELSEKFKPGRINTIITDPPFGVDNKSNMAVTKEGKEYARKIANDETPEIAIAVFNKVMDALVPKMSAEADIYIFTAHQVLKEWLEVADQLGLRHGFVRKGLLVWEKDGPGMGDLDSWGQAHEYIIYLKRGTREKQGKRRSGVLHFPQIRPNKLIHPHEKPTVLLEELIKFSTKPGEFLVDPFGGSGSLVRAARNVGRNAVAIELDEVNYRAANRALEETDSGTLF